MRSLPNFICNLIVLIILGILILSLVGCGETSEQTTSTANVPPPETSPTEIPSSTTSTTHSTPTPSPSVSNRINKWGLVDILHDYRDTPSNQFFNASVEVQSIDSDGGELLVKMNPVVDPGCTQIFTVGWEFSQSVLTVDEGDIIYVNVFNNATPNDCYMQAKASMAYGGEVVIDLVGSGNSHFLYEDPYKQYNLGESAYLFGLEMWSGFVYPPWDQGLLSATEGTGQGNIVVRDVTTVLGSLAEAPYGNFSFHISAGAVFFYTVTYLFDAVDE